MPKLPWLMSRLNKKTNDYCLGCILWDVLMSFNFYGINGTDRPIRSFIFQNIEFLFLNKGPCHFSSLINILKDFGIK